MSRSLLPAEIARVLLFATLSLLVLTSSLSCDGNERGAVIVYSSPERAEPLFEVSGSMTKDAGLVIGDPAGAAFGNLAVFTLRSLADAPLTLSVVSRSCGCSSVEFEPEVLPPSGTTLARVSMRPGPAGPKNLFVGIGARTAQGNSSSLKVQVLVTVAGLAVSTEGLVIDLPVQRRDAPAQEVVSSTFDFALFLPSKDTPYRLSVPERLGRHDARFVVTPTDSSPVGSSWAIRGRAHLAIKANPQRAPLSEPISLPLQADIGGRRVEHRMSLVLRQTWPVEFSPRSVVVRVRPPESSAEGSPNNAQGVVTCRERVAGACAEEPQITFDGDDIRPSIDRQDPSTLRLRLKYVGPRLDRPASRRLKVRFGAPNEEPYELNVLLIPVT
jgi:hypothetical protein